MRIEQRESSAARPSGRRHYPFVDVLRGVAILWVFLFHSQGEVLGWDAFPDHALFRPLHGIQDLIFFPLRIGNLGVAMFFAISGFCIHLSHQGAKSKSWMIFYLRRLFRLYPAYLFTLFVFVFIWPWSFFSWQSPTKVHELLLHLLALHNFDPTTKYAINPSLWSIASEIQLYMAYPFLLWLCRLFSWSRVLLALLLVELCLATLGGVNMRSNGVSFLIESPLAYWFSWSFGAYIAQGLLTNSPAVWISRIPLIPVFIFTLIIPLVKPLAIYDFTVVALLTSLLIQRAVYGDFRASLMNSRLSRSVANALIRLGIVSYSLYLIHQPFLMIITRYIHGTHLYGGSPLSLFALHALSLIPLFIVAHFLCRCIEKPGIRMGKLVESSLLRSRFVGFLF